jgi:hypothetical protein
MTPALSWASDFRGEIDRLSRLSHNVDSWCQAIAIKRVLARQLAEERKQKKITKFVDSLVHDKSVESILQSQ